MVTGTPCDVPVIYLLVPAKENVSADVIAAVK